MKKFASIFLFNFAFILIGTKFRFDQVSKFPNTIFQQIDILYRLIFSKYGARVLADYELYIHEDHDDDKPCVCNTY